MEDRDAFLCRPGWRARLPGAGGKVHSGALRRVPVLHGIGKQANIASYGHPRGWHFHTSSEVTFSVEHDAMTNVRRRWSSAMETSMPTTSGKPARYRCLRRLRLKTVRQAQMRTACPDDRSGKTGCSQRMSQNSWESQEASLPCQEVVSN